MIKSIISLLKDDATLSTLVSDDIFPEFAAQNQANPFVLVAQITGFEDPNITEDSTLQDSTVQVDCYANTYQEVTEIADSVDSVLHKYRGLFDSVNFQLILRTNRSDLSEIEGDKRDRRISLDYSVKHN